MFTVLRRFSIWLTMIGEQIILGPPDVVVEILSPGTARRDLGIKRDTYQAAGVPEYWIVDPESRSVEVLTLVEQRYERAGLFRENSTLVSGVLQGFTLPLDTVFPARK